MTPPFRRITVWAGNTLDFGLEFRGEDGQPFDLTGSELVFRAERETYLLRKSSADDGSGISIVDPTGGKATLHFTVEETRAMPLGALRYEIERWILTEQRTLLYGEFQVNKWVNDDAKP
jgi:hypothetical protein